MPVSLGQVLWQAAFHCTVWLMPARMSAFFLFMWIPAIGCISAALLHRCVADDDGSMLPKAEKLSGWFGCFLLDVVLRRLVVSSPRLRLLPFTPPTGDRSWEEIVHDVQATGKLSPATTQTLRRRPLAAAVWATVAISCGAYLATGILDPTARGDWFAVAWALGWPACSITLLIYLGAELGPGRFVLPITTGVMFCIQRIGYQTGRIVLCTPPSLVNLWGLPVEEMIVIVLTSFTFLLVLSLWDHLQTLLLLDPGRPINPPNNFGGYCAVILDTLRHPPQIDIRMLASLVYLDHQLLEDTGNILLFSSHKFRIPFLVINSWYASVVELVRSTGGKDTDTFETRRRALAAIKLFLVQAYDEETPALERVFTLCTIPHATTADHAIFYLFATLIPRLVPIYPFLELCDGLAVDAAFMPPSNIALAVRIAEPEFDLESHLPIKSRSQLKHYTMAVHGSFYSACTYLSWSVFEQSPSPKRPVEDLQWAEALHGKRDKLEALPSNAIARACIIEETRSLGHALGLFKILSNVQTDARQHRLYLPISSFECTAELLAVISGVIPPKHIMAPLLKEADEIYAQTSPVLANLPRQARLDVRRVVHKVFNDAKEVRNRYV